MLSKVTNLYRGNKECSIPDLLLPAEPPISIVLQEITN
jgi:hypothetical protein